VNPEPPDVGATTVPALLTSTVVVLVAHGSRAATANQAHLDLATSLDQRITPTVIGAFMELARPSIGDAIAAAAAQGATVVAVLPHFLHPGRHQELDIPQLVADAAEQFPGVQVRLLEAFGADPAVVDLLAGQVDRALTGP
jgi:sirohydrochlorin ferrochelatase